MSILLVTCIHCLLYTHFVISDMLDEIEHFIGCFTFSEDARKVIRVSRLQYAHLFLHAPPLASTLIWHGEPPQWMTVSASNIPIPVPNAKVAISHLSDVPLKRCNTRPFLSCGLGTVALSCSSRCSQVYRSLTVLNTFLKQFLNLKIVSFYFHINFTHENTSLFLSHISYNVKFLCPFQGVWHCT